MLCLSVCLSDCLFVCLFVFTFICLFFALFLLSAILSITGIFFILLSTSTDSNMSAVVQRRPYPKAGRKRQLMDQGRMTLLLSLLYFTTIVFFSIYEISQHVQNLSK